MSEDEPKPRQMRVWKLDDLLRERDAPEPDALQDQVRRLRDEVKRLKVRQNLMAARQQQQSTMLEANKRLLRDLWDWVRSFETFIGKALTARRRMVNPEGNPPSALEMIERFTVQHVEVLYLSEELATYVATPHIRGADGAARALQLLEALFGACEAHLKQEDEVFTKHFADHWDDDIRENVDRHLGDVGGLHQIFAEFMLRWGDVEFITADRERFINDLLVVLDMLAYRIEQEDTVLFPMIERFATENAKAPPGTREF